MSFNIIKNLGKPIKVIMPDGTEVARKELIAVEWRNPDTKWDEKSEYSLVRTEDYDDHMVYETPKHLRIAGTSDYMCSCGSPAVVVDSSNMMLTPHANTKQPLMVCMFYTQHGHHTTTYINKRTFGSKSEVLLP